MTHWQFVITGLYAALVAIALFRHLILTLAMRRMIFLTPRHPRLDRDFPLVSILVPAKDEAHGIESCVRSLLLQDYPNFEILVVDDRSGDDTASIVERIADENKKVRLIRVTELPAGWTGKTHALHLGQQHARGEWLLFVDADTQQHASCLSVVLADAVRNRTDLMTLLPALESSSFWERTVQPFAGVCLMVLFPPGTVNESTDPAMGFANGQFILIRRTAYEAIGGHEAVRDKFVEDIHLGRNILRAGLRLRLAMGRDISAVRMYASLPGIVRGWSRILYSAVDARPLKLYLLLAATCVFSVLSYVTLAWTIALLFSGDRSEFVVAMFWLGVAHEVVQTTIMARIYRLSGSQLKYLAVRLLAVFVMLWVFIRAIDTCRTHRVVWRGTSYGPKVVE